MLHLQIHAGTHKTASTAIQRTLREIRPELVAAGINMPGLIAKKAKHSDFRHELGRSGPRIDAPATTALLADLAAQRGNGRNVLTNETFIGSDPAILKAALAPARADRTDIFFYVRPQIGLLTSLYLQSVKNGRVIDSARAYHDSKGESHAFDFADSIEGYAAIWGKDAVRVREFTRDGLVGGSIIADFWDWLDLPKDLLPRALAVEQEQNFTPKAEVAELLRALGCFFRAQEGKDPRGLGGTAIFTVFRKFNELAPDLPGTAYRLPVAFQQELTETYAEGRRHFADRWFDKPPTSAWLTERITAPEPPIDPPHDTITAIFRAAIDRMQAKGKSGYADLTRAFLDRLPSRTERGARVVPIDGLADGFARQTDPIPVSTPAKGTTAMADEKTPKTPEEKAARKAAKAAAAPKKTPEERAARKAAKAASPDAKPKRTPEERAARQAARAAEPAKTPKTPEERAARKAAKAQTAANS